MITPSNPSPSIPTPGTQVCVTFTTSGGGSPVGQVNHETGGTISPTISAVAHPANTYVLCFVWPPGNTSSDVTIVVGSETLTFPVVGVA